MQEGRKLCANAHVVFEVQSSSFKATESDDNYIELFEMENTHTHRCGSLAQT